MSKSDGKPKRIRPWRCINCGDRFAKDQTSAQIHWTDYAPREWERTDAVDS